MERLCYMVDGVSNVGYGAYNNYSAYKDDFLAQSYFNNVYKSSSTPSDSVAFSGNSDKKVVADKSEEKESSGNSVLLPLLIATGAFLTGKYFNKIKGFFTKGAAKEVLNNANKTVNKAKGKAQDVLTNAQRNQIKNTSVTGASNPITIAKEAEIITNIDTKHVKGNTKKLVENSVDDIVTEAQQKAYDAEIAYRPMTQKQNAKNNSIKTQNAKERAEKNSIVNNSKGGEKLETVATNVAKAEATTKKIKNGTYLNPANNNKYEIKDGKVVKIILNNGNKDVVDPLKIAKHLDKHNVQLETFATATNKQQLSAGKQNLNVAA